MSWLARDHSSRPPRYAIGQRAQEFFARIFDDRIKKYAAMNLFYQNRPASRQLSSELASAPRFFPRSWNLVAFKSSGAKHIERRIRHCIFALNGFGASDRYAVGTERQCQLYLLKADIQRRDGEVRQVPTAEEAV
jgi:hypothetical protein